MSMPYHTRETIQAAADELRSRRISVSSHTRCRPHDDAKMKITDQLWNEYVGEVLSMELAAKMAEPLDDPQFNDLSEDQKQRMREC